MHHALNLQEILYNIFGHLVPQGDRAWTYEESAGISALAKLGRACRGFKEPALDVLWSELPDLLALARCVPDVIHSKEKSRYAFKRPLTEVEWATIRNYSRRVWAFRNYTHTNACLEEESLETLFSYTNIALFPSLRSISWGYGKPFPPLHTGHQPLRLLNLDCRSGTITGCRNVLESVGHCPLITTFRLQLSRQDAEFDRIVSSGVLRWSNLRVLECSEVALSTDVILHIAHMSSITHLSFILSDEAAGGILDLDLVLVFSRLTWCEITSRRLLSVANLFACSRLPAIKTLTVKFPGSLAKQTLRLFATALGRSCSSSTLTHLSVLSQRYLFRLLSPCGELESNGDCAITYEDLYPCKIFAGLRSLKANFEQPVHLTNDDLVDLGSAWPLLEDLIINEAGWRSAGGLTFHGLIQLLRACPSLRNFCILFDTATFTKIPDGMELAYPQRRFGRVNLVESPLGADVFAGVVDVFVAIGFSPRSLVAWRCVEIGQQWVIKSTQTFRSWREVGEEVKAKIASG